LHHSSASPKHSPFQACCAQTVLLLELGFLVSARFFWRSISWVWRSIC